jgi:hypothetical protein
LQQAYDELETAVTTAGRMEDAAEIRRESLRHSPAQSAAHAITSDSADIESDKAKSAVRSSNSDTTDD